MWSNLGRSTLFSMPKTAEMQLLLRIRNSPDALALRATRGLLTTTRYAEPGVSIEKLGGLSIDQRDKSETCDLSNCRTAKRIDHHMKKRIEMRQSARLDSIRYAAAEVRFCLPRFCSLLRIKQTDRTANISVGFKTRIYADNSSATRCSRSATATSRAGRCSTAQTYCGSRNGKIAHDRKASRTCLSAGY